MFPEEKPESLGAIGEKVFYKTHLAGANGDVYEPEVLGAFGEFVKTLAAGGSRRWRCFEKQSTALAAARTINPCSHIT